MRRVHIAWPAALVALTTVAALALVTDGQAVPAGHTLTVEKVVVGSHPLDNEYKVLVDCDGAETSIAFDANGDPDPPGSNMFGVDLNTHCTVTEPDDGGAASVSFACEVTSANQQLVDCINDNEAAFGDEAGGAATITVTNTFEEPTTTTTTPPTTTTAVSSVVEVQPTFTG